MYNKECFKYARMVIPEKLCSTDSTSCDRASLNSTTSSTTYSATLASQIIGSPFECTIAATTGAIYIYPDTPTTTFVATSSNSFKLGEGEVIDLKVKNYMTLRGDSTTAKYQAIIWSNS